MDAERCEAITHRGTRCARRGHPAIPDAKGLRYVCNQHWAHPPKVWTR